MTKGPDKPLPEIVERRRRAEQSDPPTPNTRPHLSLTETCLVILLILSLLLAIGTSLYTLYISIKHLQHCTANCTKLGTTNAGINHTTTKTTCYCISNSQILTLWEKEQ